MNTRNEKGTLSIISPQYICLIIALTFDHHKDDGVVVPAPSGFLMSSVSRTSSANLTQKSHNEGVDMSSCPQQKRLYGPKPEIFVGKEGRKSPKSPNSQVRLS